MHTLSDDTIKPPSSGETRGINKTWSPLFTAARCLSHAPQLLFIILLWCLCACERVRCGSGDWWWYVVRRGENRRMILVSGNIAAIRRAEWWSLADNNAHLSTNTCTYPLELSLLSKWTSFTFTWYTQYIGHIAPSMLTGLSVWRSLTFTFNDLGGFTQTGITQMKEMGPLAHDYQSWHTAQLVNGLITAD